MKLIFEIKNNKNKLIIKNINQMKNNNNNIIKKP